MTRLLVLSLAAGALGCSPNQLLGDKQLPPDVPDPAQTETPAGALAAYRGALVQLRTAFGGYSLSSFIPITGLFTDEIGSGGIGNLQVMLVDSRFLPEDPGTGVGATSGGQIESVYGQLQKVRGQARQARGMLRAYSPDSIALVGHLHAVEGYADVMLADFFCSGIPLSTLDFGGNFTYQPGTSTEEVYQHAVALFDSALTVTADSVRVLNFARVGKGRALLALGQYAAAATSVAEVPDDFRYTLDYSATTSPGATGTFAESRSYIAFAYENTFNTMVDAEGENGLPYISSGDPRSAWVAADRVTLPALYPADGSGSIVLASGVEARLIQAEAALQGNDAGWLTTLNALRTTCADVATCPTPAPAGIGGVPGLPPLTDPVNPEARIDLLFRERAFWLFLTGHRQGDLRRLIRQYGREVDRVYPTGPYQGAFNAYGIDVTAPIPGTERASNPLFTGCRSRGA